MSIIRIKTITTYDRMRLVSKEYKLWGIPLVKHTYESKGKEPSDIRAYG